MPDIQCLPSHVADLIAAGEVVERPASVAKELMENAIDAGASAMVVEIQHGGLTYLRITDNGCGIDAGELQTAFLRHATSKLRTRVDLEAIGTLGFRGEALAAISAVSRVEMLLPDGRRRRRGPPCSGGGRPGHGGGGGLPPGHHHGGAGPVLQHPRPTEVYEKGRRRGGRRLRHRAAGGPVPPGGVRQVPPGR